MVIVCPIAAGQTKTGGGACGSCHPKQTAGYQRTGMANSISRPHKQPSGRFTHAFSDSVFSIQAKASGMRQQVERNGFSADYDVAYVIGSGNNAFGYLTRIGNYLFQSPLSYYSKRSMWDMAPGYERDREPDFTRPVTLECLLCHSGRPRAAAGALNRYEAEPFEVEAISCDRCHGIGEAHIAKPSAHNIVNPAKLPIRARDSVCEQCHLGGEARIPNLGKKISEFRPGENLEDTFSVYVFETPADKASSMGLKVVSHVEQLALSRCASRSGGKMWCGTCHDPHGKPAAPERYYREKCIGCHTQTLPAAHPAGTDCAGCHMPRRQTRDGGHTAFTDHRIARVPAGNAAALRRKLIAWREPGDKTAQRNLGLANILVGERDQSAAHMDAGFRQLTEVYESQPDDPAVLTSLGLVILRKGGAVEAARLYERAVVLEPHYAPYHINAATAWTEAGELSKAISHLETAIQMDPSLEMAYRKLGEIYTRTKQREKARETLRRYLQFMPGNVTARSALDLQ